MAQPHYPVSGPFSLGRDDDDDDEGEAQNTICISKCHADLQPRFYLIRWGGVSPTVEYTAYSGVNVRRDAIHA